MDIPSSLQSTWQKVTQDKSVSKEDFKELVKAAAPDQDPTQMDDAEEKFLGKLQSELVKNDLATKGSVPIGAINFSDAPVVEQKETAPPVEEKKEVAENKTVTTGKENVESEEHTESVNVAVTPNTQAVDFTLPPPQLPTATVLTEWHNYSKKEKTAFAEAFGQKPPSDGKVPVLAQGQAESIVNTFGAGNIKQFQQMVGTKDDDKFGPHTFLMTKVFVADKINGSQTVEDLTKLKGFLDVLGNDNEVEQMKNVVSQRLQATQNYLGDRQSVQNFMTNVQNIVAKADPNSMDSLKQAKSKIDEEFGKLSAPLQQVPQVIDMRAQAQSTIDNAIKALQAKLETDEIAKQKSQLGGELTTLVKNAVDTGLKTGDSGKVKEAKAQIDPLVEKYPKIKDSDDVKAAKQQAHAMLDSTITKIDGINALIAKPEWTKDETAQAVKDHSELPEGDFKKKLGDSIQQHDEAYRLKQKNISNLPTTREGLHDVIGNGFWNLENKEGSKGMFQLVSKQGLLGEAITKMNYDDQVRAVKIMTSDIKPDKKTGSISDSDNFNLAIARSIYENLSKSSNVDKEFKDKTVELLKKDKAPEKFDSFQIDLKDYVKGMKFSIGSDRMGSEKEAALTMARAIINGEVGKQSLGELSRYELSDLANFVEKKGSKDEKNALLNTVAKAYNEGVPVNIESLDKGEKSKVIKGLLDIPDANEGKVSELLKKAGKKAIFETVNNEKLDPKQLTIVGKHTNGDQMADDPKVAGKILVGMITNYNKQEDKSNIKLEDINKFIDQVDKDWWDDDNTMKNVLSGLGEGKNSEYAKFNELAPQTMGKIWKISD